MTSLDDTSGTARVAPDGTYHAKSSTSVVNAENLVNAQLQQIWEVMGFTQEAAALRLRDVRTSGCGWRTEMRISSAKDGHKPAMTTMWLKKGHGFELRRLLMRKTKQCRLLWSAQTDECSPIH